MSTQSSFFPPTLSIVDDQFFCTCQVNIHKFCIVRLKDHTGKKVSGRGRILQLHQPVHIAILGMNTLYP